jgi:chorismate synthase
MLRWNLDDARDVLERASARETVARVVAGAVARSLLAAIGVHVAGATRAIGDVRAADAAFDRPLDALVAARDASPVLCPDEVASARMVEAIDAARADGDTLGGIVEVRVTNPLAGLGSVATASERLEARLGAALLAVPAVKGVEIGPAFDVATRRGSAAHDAILSGPEGLHRPTNHAGGIEGGMSNGEPIVVRAAMKPISTLMRPLPSVDVRDGSPSRALVERSDVCAVPPLGVIAEAVTALVIADAVLERVGGTTLDEVADSVARIRRRHDDFRRRGTRI